MSRVCSSYKVGACAAGAGRPEGAPLLELPTKLVGGWWGVDGGYIGVVRWGRPIHQAFRIGRTQPAMCAGLRALPIWSAAQLVGLFDRAKCATGNLRRRSSTPGAGCGHQFLVLRSFWRSPMGSLVVGLPSFHAGRVAS